jgi:hypothetical protein
MMNTRIFLQPVSCIVFTGVLVLGLSERTRTPAVKVESSVSLEKVNQVLGSLLTLQEAYSTVDGANTDLVLTVFDLEDRELAALEEVEAKEQNWLEAVQKANEAIKACRIQGKEIVRLRESLSSYLDEMDTLIQGAVADLKSVTRDQQKKPEEKRIAIQCMKACLKQAATGPHEAFCKVWEPFMKRFQEQPTCVLGGLAAAE